MLLRIVGRLSVCCAGVQDSCEEVREKFLDKLHKGLQNMQLPLWYLSIMVYVGTEPSKVLRVKVRGWGMGVVSE